MSAGPIAFSDRFTQIPKVREICPAGVPPHLIPTYAALADFANNATGECYPKWETLARILGKALRTIQRHVHQLAGLGLVEFLDQPEAGGLPDEPPRRRRDVRGRYASFRVRLPHIAAAAARVRERRKANGRRYQQAERERKEVRKSRRRERVEKRPGRKKPPPISGEEGARRRREGYEWLFDEPSAPRHAILDRRAPSSAPTTGHGCPVVPIHATSTENNPPPSPPPRPDGTPPGPPARAETGAGAAGSPPDPLQRSPSPAEAAWSHLLRALLELRPDADPRELRASSLHLDGPNLWAVLRDAPVVRWRGLERREVGRLADRTRRLYGDDLRRLWPLLSGDPDACLDLR